MAKEATTGNEQKNVMQAGAQWAADFADKMAEAGQASASVEEKAAAPAATQDATAAAKNAPEPKPRNGTPGKKLEGVVCPRCRSNKTPVKRGTQYASEGVTRYRTCDGCGHRFTTFQPWIPGKEPGQNATEGKEDIVG